MIQVNELNKNYDQFHLKCSMEVAPGMITGLVGPNGAGKSTLFKAILGLISIDGGSIQVMGKNAAQLDGGDKQKIGTVICESGFSQYLRIKDIIPILAAMYHEYDKQWFIERCNCFRLPMDKQIREFSTGMKVKLKLLVAMCHKAELLVLDEPTTGLDVTAREEVLDMLREYMEQDEKRSILISSHISTDLEGLCDDVYMIHNGNIVIHEEMNVLLDQYAVLKVDESQYNGLDKKYLLKVKKESFGYRCLTSQKRFYEENYPNIVVEKDTLDELIMILVKGENV